MSLWDNSPFELENRANCGEPVAMSPVYWGFLPPTNHLVVGKKMEKEHKRMSETPRYFIQLSFAEEVQLYREFLVNPMNGTIGFLIAYYKACGLETEQRTLRISMLKKNLKL